ncbi:MAG TPA: hypothetical protein VK599_18550 [Streptosporangiaceae bacterium]|nr:hypothetical protein [Streptosporangiaceae bacterium]
MPTDPPTCCIVLTSAEAGGRIGRHQDRAEAQAHDDQGGQHASDVAGGHGELGQIGGPAGGQQHAHGDQGPGPDPCAHGAVQGGGHQDAGDQRQEQQPGGQRAVSLDLLHVEGEEQEGAEDRNSGDADRDVGAAPGAVQDHSQRQQRVTGSLFGDDERAEQDRAEDERAEGQRGGPAGRLGVGEAEDDQEEPGAGQHGARPVHPRPGRRAAAVDVSQGTRHGYRGEDQVDEQRVTPGQVLGENPAQDQAHRAAADGDRAEDSERPAPLARVPERADQGAQRGWRENGAEGALQRPGRHQHHERDGGAPDGGGDGESDQARDEDPLAAVHVAEPPAHQQQAAEGQGVARHHPLPVTVGETQRLLRGRQRDVHDRGVQHHHQLGDCHHDQDHPAPVRSCRVALRIPGTW